MKGLEFKKFASIKRLNRNCTITEKIDGTNAQLQFNEDGQMLCGSRNKEISPEQDNYGFSTWAEEHQERLFATLGEGTHYGEWWGGGCQIGYGLEKGVMTFSLFNTGRWFPRDVEHIPGLSVVPVLYQGAFSTNKIEQVLGFLKENGSVCSPGFREPEGIVIYHDALDELFKVTIKNDELPKKFTTPREG